jgi:hypothetical protein
MKDVGIDKSKFDALLRRMIDSKPLTYKETVAKPKLRKDGTPKRKTKKPSA